MRKEAQRRKKMKKMITPADLQQKTVAQDTTGTYDWEKQVYQFDTCKWGTTSSTSFGTNSGQWNFSDDSNSDSYTD